MCTRASSNPHPGSAPSPPGAEPRRATAPSFVTRSLPPHLLLRTGPLTFSVCRLLISTHAWLSRQVRLRCLFSIAYTTYLIDRSCVHSGMLMPSTSPIFVHTIHGPTCDTSRSMMICEVTLGRTEDWVLNSSESMHCTSTVGNTYAVLL